MVKSPVTTKEYLSQAYRIDQRINSKLEQINTLRNLATKATTALNHTNSDFHSKDPHFMENVIVKMVDLEHQIHNDIDTLIDLKKEIVLLIKQIKNPEYQTLLELRYLCFKTWEQIAVEMGYDLRYLHKLHSRALIVCKDQN